MSDHQLTDAEKIYVVESIIEDLKARAPFDTRLPELKKLATFLRAQRPSSVPKVLEALEFQVCSALRSKARLGYIEVGHWQAIAEGLLAHWPVVRKALEKFGEEDGTVRG